MNSKERIYKTLAGEAVDRVAVTPIFMARAAELIGKTYRQYYLDAAVLAEAQLAVAEMFGVDQVSAISDPWREASAYGMEFDYPDNAVGHAKANLIQSRDDLVRLGNFDLNAERIVDRVQGVELLVKAVGDEKSVLGWVEGPIAEYADLRGVSETMMDLMDDPAMFCEAAEVIVANAIAFAKLQVQAGADMIGIGDAAASLIGPELYEKYVFQFQKKLVQGIHDLGATVKLHICGNIGSIVGQMAKTGADIVDVDWMVPLDKARQDVGEGVVLCGNFDPAGVLLRGTPDDIAAAAKDCIDKAGIPFILMPGCEVPPGTPVENIRAFCKL